jgi:SAM-dependent methyltransferase
MKADFPAKVDMVCRYSLSKSPRLLDVGCGKGFFVKAASATGILAEGIDVSHSGIEYAVQTLGVKATAGLLEQQNSNGWREAFDVVTLWATIEHLVDPLSVLQAIHKSLKSKGIILCDTGLGHVFWEKFLPGHSQWYDAPQHMFVFSEKGLVALLEKAGFRIIHIDTNFERSMLRRYVRWIRHVTLCMVGGLFISPLLGKRALLKMRQEAKWPIGRLVTVVAQKIES